ncbi:MAG: hypothetical protein ACRDQW_02425 [Haloechinothrix sp.]
MNDGFFTDIDRLAERSKDFEGLAERAGSVADRLKSALDSGSPVWGSDAVGESFAAAHAGPATQAWELLSGLNSGLGGVGGRFADAAAAYRAADDSAIDGISGAGRALGGHLDGTT